MRQTLPIRVLTDIPMREAKLVERDGEEYRVVEVEDLNGLFYLFKTRTITISRVPEHLEWTYAHYVVR